MRYIIDGYNLIMRVGLLSGSLEESRDGLMTEIEAGLKRKSSKDSAVIVFDSSRFGKSSGDFNLKSVKVIFTAGKDTADSKIIKMVKGLGKEERKNVTVVSSDGAVRENCMFLYARVMSSEEFYEKL